MCLLVESGLHCGIHPSTDKLLPLGQVKQGPPCHLELCRKWFLPTTRCLARVQICDLVADFNRPRIQQPRAGVGCVAPRKIDAGAVGLNTTRGLGLPRFRTCTSRRGLVPKGLFGPLWARGMPKHPWPKAQRSSPNTQCSPSCNRAAGATLRTTLGEGAQFTALS